MDRRVYGDRVAVLVEQVLIAVALVAALGGCSALALRALRSGWRPSAAHALAASLLGLGAGVRLTMRPRFVHSNLHGFDLLDALMAFPSPPAFREEYGRAGFMFVGAIEWLFGGGWPTVAAVNACAGVALCVGVTAVAWQWRGPVAGVAVAAACALFPPFVRVAMSEDLHALGAAWGALALWAAVRSRRGERVDAATVCVAASATILAAFTRQQFVLWAPLVLGVALRGRLSVVARSYAARAALGVGVVAGALRAATTLGASGDRLSYMLMPLLTPIALHPSLLLRHPLLASWSGAAALALATYAGVRALRDGDTVGRWISGFFFASLASGIWLGVVPSEGVRYAFRVPAFALMMPLVGAGVAALWERFGRSGRGVLVVAAVGVWGVAPALTLVSLRGGLDPLTQELALLEGAGALIPPGEPVYTTDLRVEPQLDVGYRLPARELERLGFTSWRDVEGAYTGRRWFLQGVGCWGFGVGELVPGGRPQLGPDADYAQVLALAQAFWDAPQQVMPLFGGAHPASMRAECATEAAKGTRFVPLGVVRVPADDAPFTLFVHHEIEVGLWEIPADAGGWNPQPPDSD